MAPYPANISAGRSASLALSVASGVLVPANGSRFGLLIKNDTAIDIWINLLGVAAVAAAGSGAIKIAAGAEWRLPDTWRYTGVVNAIAASGTPAITVYEW